MPIEAGKEAAMSVRKHKFGLWLKKHRLHLAPTQIIALTFAVIILAGALLLTLPVSSRSGESSGFLTALFTATSATCVTGLVLVDTWTQWSGFGQGVILAMIEIGGLGFMSAAAIVVFMLRRRVGLKQRLLMAQAISAPDMAGVVRLQKWVLFGSLGIQAVGAIVLFLRFLPEFGLQKAAVWGVFHSISAFCNAGFDIFGSLEPGMSVIIFNDDPVILCTLAGLVILSSLGFFVWEDVATKRSWKKLSVYTKLVLLTSLVLILGGAVLILLLEWSNPETIGNMPLWQKILNSFFQSVTLRTAGFSGVDQASLTDAGKIVSMVLMFIGGSSGSTAGGVKTVTMVVLLLFVWNRMRGRETVCVFKRTIPQDKVMDAMSIVTIVMVLALVGGCFICATSGFSFSDAMYETVSALATVGLSAGGSGNLGVAGKLLIIMYMYFGRVGVLTLSLGFLMGDKAEERFRYAETNLLIG
jgi:trk system potassium uptake protein TrkH